MKLKKSFFLIKVVSIVLMIVFVHNNAGAWSSIDQSGSSFAATHQFLNAEAYKLLQKHPAFKRSGFPALQDIQAYSGVDFWSNGPGPDGTGNSLYSWHYYNPDTNKGAAPETVARYYGYLKKNLIEKKPVRDRVNNKVYRNVSPPERNAAYLAHFIQDMTVPFHTLGLPRVKALRDRPGSEQQAGPYGNPTDPEEWQSLVERYLSMQKKDNAMDWFDPTYYDGLEPAWVKNSTHVLYEGLVEINYKRNYFSNRAKWEGRMKSPSPFYKQGDLDGMAIRLARATKDRLGTKSSPGPLWFDNRSFLNRELIGGAFPVPLGNVIPVPFDQWLMAVQATYSVWRASFSALAVDPADIRMVKAQDKPDLFLLKVKVRNLDPVGVAGSVSLSYKGLDGLNVAGTASVGNVPSDAESKEVECGTVVLAGGRPAQGEIELTVSGDFKSVPDSGQAKFTIPLDRIRMEGTMKMEDLRGAERNWARDFLSGEPYNLKVHLVSVGQPPTKDEALRIVAQSPDPGSWIASGDSVTLKAYDNRLVSVPLVIGKEKSAALEILTRADLLPIPTEQITESSTIGQQTVIAQTPSENELVTPKSRVIIIVSIPKRPVPPQPSQPVGGPTPPDSPALSSLPTSTPVTSSAGGLLIKGPDTLIARVGGQYQATDGMGNAYTDAVTWNTSVENRLTVNRSGTAIAHKAGEVTIIARKDDMSAYKKVEILARTPNLVGLTVQQALQELRSLGLNGKAQSDSTENNGKISRQSIPAGKPVKADTTILFEITTTETTSMNTIPSDAVFSSQGGEPSVSEGNENEDPIFSSSGGGPIADSHSTLSTASSGSQGQANIFSSSGGSAVEFSTDEGTTLLGQNALTPPQSHEQALQVETDSNASSTQPPPSRPSNALSSTENTTTSKPDVEKIGKYVFAEMNQFLPRNLKKLGQRFFEIDIKNDYPARYYFYYLKSFNLGVATSNNPGFNAEISYGMSPQKINDIVAHAPSDKYRTVLKNMKFKKYKGAGWYRLSSADYRNGSKNTITHHGVLLWVSGEWSIVMRTWDHPYHPGAMFGPDDGAINYMFLILDHIVPRLNNALTMFDTLGNREGNSVLPQSNPSTNDSSLNNSDRINLLNIDAN